MARPKTLVVFFSRTGTTERVARSISRALGADLEPLRELRSRRGPIGWLRSGYEGRRQRAAPTLPLAHALADYDLIFVGTPTWSGGLSSPVRGFLMQNRGRLPMVALFATCSGYETSDAIQQMAALLNTRPVAELTILEADAKRSPAVWVGEFVEATLCAWEQQRATA
jgi:flavodoxin